ncbi:MAG: hypothetical protein ACTSWL_06060, partial [Promethearchaeota archaeon]
SSDLTHLPYFNDTTPLADWLTDNMTDENTLPDSPNDPIYPLYFGESDENGVSVVDDKHYFEDFAVLLDGFLQLAYPEYTSSEFLDYLNHVGDLGLKGQEGYYTFLNADLSQNSTIQELNGNAQLLISLARWVLDGSASIENVKTVVDNQWALLNNFWDGTNSAFNHSSNNAVTDKFVQDQFVAAIADYLISEADINENPKDQADTIMNIIEDGIYSFDTDAKLYHTSLSQDLSSTIDQDFNLTTNAYGIWALVEKYVANGMSTLTTLNKAEDVYNSLKEYFWNDTYSLFITKVQNNAPSYTILDNNINLQDNAIMLMALARLFEASGNITYFNEYMQMYQAIQENFKDSQNGNYFTSIVNKNKNLLANAYYIRTCGALDKIAKTSKANLVLNETDFIKGENSILNISINNFFEYSIASNEMSTLINGSTYFIIIRDPNDSIIFQSIQTPVAANFDLLYSINDTLDLGQYHVSIRVNHTGLITLYKEDTFTIGSGYAIENSELSSDETRAGSNFDLNLTIDNSLDLSFNMTINLNGTSIINQTISTLELVNNTLNNFTYAIQTLANADFGETSLNVELVKNETVYATKNIPFTIISPIEVSAISQENNVFRGESFNVEVLLDNLADVEHSVTIEISGDYTSTTKTVTLVADQLSTKNVSVFLDQDVPLGMLTYHIKITRSGNGDIIDERDLITNVAKSFEIVSVNSPISIEHGEGFGFDFTIINNLKSIQNISIVITGDGEKNITQSLISGSNSFGTDFTSYNSPYNLGTKHFMIVIRDNNGILLYQSNIEIKLNPSIGSLTLGYIIPLLIPIIAVVIVKHIAMENKKRLS